METGLVVFGVNFAVVKLDLAVEFFLWTVGGVAIVSSLLAGSALLERELRLDRGVGDDTAELREDRVERLEDGRGELEDDRVEETTFRALVDFPFFAAVFFGMGGL